MYTISDQQIDFILADLRHRGIRTKDLEFNLLDHICILIEQGLDEEGDFNIFYSAVRQNLKVSVQVEFRS